MLALRLLSDEIAQPDITWMLWVGLGFFVLIVFIGWLVSRSRKSEESHENRSKKRAEPGHH